jgi:hypothetical protein
MRGPTLKMPERNRTMTPPARPSWFAALAGAALLSVGVRASVAQPRQAPRVAGKYSATFQEVASNCSGMGMSLRSAPIELAQSGQRNVQVTVPGVPIMRGVVSRAGKFKAEAKRGKTATQGVDGRFSVAGRVDEKGIQFLFIAEYYRSGRPMCTQSWNASGPRQ